MAVFQPWGSFPCGSCSHSVLLWSSAGDWTGRDHPDGFLVHLLLIPLAVQAAQEVCWLHAPQLTGSQLCGDHLSLQGSRLQKLPLLVSTRLPALMEKMTSQHGCIFPQ